MDLKNKRILITAGPTWVPIDSVRVISNIATGKTGILLAEKLNQCGARVTLILGPVGDCSLHRKIRIIRFRFFEELREAIKKELTSKHYDIIIHCAAVSDFRPQRLIKGKLKSEKAHPLALTPLPKIVTEIRRASPSAKLIMFKLETGVSERQLMSRGRKALRAARADIAVANKIRPSYKAYIIDRKRIYAKADSKEKLVQRLIAIIS